MLTSKQLFDRRAKRARYQIKKAANGKPRLSVYRSASQIYVQLIDDLAGKTLASASTLEADLRKKLKSGGNKDAAVEIGKLIAERAKKAGVKTVVFDRGGYKYHGRVKALGDAARDAGLDF